MSIRGIFFLAVLLLLFAAAAWSGAWARRIGIDREQAVQPGWCCMPDRRQCVVAKGEADCRIARGATFSWDRSSCEAACDPISQ